MFINRDFQKPRHYCIVHSLWYHWCYSSIYLFICFVGHMVGLHFLTLCVSGGLIWPFAQWIINRCKGSYFQDISLLVWYTRKSFSFSEWQNSRCWPPHNSKWSAWGITVSQTLHRSMMNTYNVWDINVCWFILLRFWDYLLLLHNSAHPDWCADVSPILDSD